jgi:head-tail adaptor
MSLALPAATLNLRVTVQTATETQTALGVVLNWTDSRTVWGCLVPLNFLQSALQLVPRFQQLYPEATHRLILRGNIPVEAAKTRFRIRGKIYVPIGIEYSPEGEDRLNFTVVAVARRAEEER